MYTLNDISRKIANAKTLDFGSIFSSAIDTFKKVWLQGLVTYLLSMVLILPFFLILYIPMIFVGITNPESLEDGLDFDGLSAIVIVACVLLFVIFFISMGAVSLGLKAAFYKIVRDKDLGLNTSDDYFFFLKKQYLKKTIGLSLTILGIFLLAYTLCILPVFYVIVPVYYMVIIYALNPDMPNSEILKAGFQLGNKKWFLSFGLLFVAGILAGVVGFLLCFIGIYVTQQFIDLPCYHVYKEVIGVGDSNPIDEVGAPSE